jgi:hypothetical protein
MRTDFEHDWRTPHRLFAADLPLFRLSPLRGRFVHGNIRA